MPILEGAEITEYEVDNPSIAELSEGISDSTIDRITVLEICDYLGITDRNYNDPDIMDRIVKVIDIIGKDNPLQKIESIVSEIGFKPGMLDDIYSKVMLDKEIKRQSTNLDNLLKHKYGNSNNV